MTYNKMATIQKTYERCQSEGIGISRNLIRNLAISGEVPCVLAGTTRLLNYDKLLEYLETGTVKNPPKRSDK